jgi:branched-subunit amino acid ABC-type transport system permease component
MLLISSSGVSYDAALNLSLLGFGAFVILGIRGPVRAVLGGLTIGIIEVFSTAYAPAAVATAIPLLVILVVLATGRFDLAPQGSRA